MKFIFPQHFKNIYVADLGSDGAGFESQWVMVGRRTQLKSGHSLLSVLKGDGANDFMRPMSQKS